MPSKYSINSTENQDVSSAGASLKNSTKQWSPKSSKVERKLDIRFPSRESPIVLTDVSPTGLTESRFNYKGIYEKLTHRYSQPKQSYRNIIYFSGHGYLSDYDRELTSVIVPPQLTYLPELPEEIKECLEKLQNDKIDEDFLYENADQIAEWFTDSPDEYQKTIEIYIQQLFHAYSPIGLRILLSAFCDAEVTINDETLLRTVAGFLESSDKQLAQAAASCLLLCGKSLGRRILEYSLIEDKELPHAKLIQGIIDLLGID